MKLVFEVTEDDLVAFHHWYLCNDVAQKSAFFRRRWGSALGITAMGMLGCLLIRAPWWAYFLMTGAGAGVALYLPATRRRVARNSVRRQLDGYDTRGLLGTRTLEFTDDGLLETSEIDQHLTHWTAQIRVQETPDYVLFIMQPGEALVVARNRVLEGDLHAFLTATRKRVLPFPKA
jgi:hypothetical protein